MQDTSNHTLTHVTDLNFEGFAEPQGNVIFAPQQSFAVIYTTPSGTPFTLQSVSGAPLAGGQDIQAPQTCGTAPEPRLTVGGMGRMTFTDGSLTRVRNAPNGDIITQVPEGTTFDVLAGPECSNDFFWWNIRLNNGTVGWSAEGDSDGYYLEPFTSVQVTPIVAVPVNPTATPANPGDIQAPPTAVPANPGDIQAQPTATMGIVEQPQFAPTPTIVLQAVPICTNSPASQLQVGMTATVQVDGTLAMRTNLSDETPSNQLQSGTVVSIIGGPQCRNNLRMWQVNANGVTGWVAEGFGQVYYLVP
jgi:hypothetical protein